MVAYLIVGGLSFGFVGGFVCLLYCICLVCSWLMLFGLFSGLGEVACGGWLLL